MTKIKNKIQAILGALLTQFYIVSTSQIPKLDKENRKGKTTYQ